MNDMPIYAASAQAFAAEGVDHDFILIGDGNMHWGTAMNRGHARCCAASMAQVCIDRGGRRRYIGASTRYIGA